jgi:hypothetical protein
VTPSSPKHPATLQASVADRSRPGALGAARARIAGTAARRPRWPSPRSIAEAAFAFLAYLGFAVWLTWPMPADLDSRIYGSI